jgi:GPH family glycoside/pentoside/hexuronide:cation symporter
MEVFSMSAVDQGVQAPIQHEKKVPVKSAVSLAFADSLCSLMCSFAEGSVINYFFIFYLGLDQWVADIVWILFGIWNAINDPIYGFLADRTKNKLGRRIPWIRYGGPIYAALFILTWAAFPGMKGNQVFLAFQMAISLFLFDTLYTAVASALYVMPYEMAVTNKARSPIFVWKIIFSIISTGVPLFLNGFLDNILYSGYWTFFGIMCGIGVLAGIVIFGSTFFYKENGYVKDEPQPKFWAGLWACLKNKSFLFFEVISFTVIFAQTSLMDGISAAFPMWGDAWLGDGQQNTAMYICYGAMLLGAASALVFDVKMREKLGAKVLTLIMCVAMATGCFIGAFLGRYFWAIIIAFLLIGVGFAGGMYLIPVVNGDVIDKDEIDNGSRREGTYAGVNSLITKPAMSLATVAFNGIFQAFGLDKNITKTNPDNGEITIDFAAQSTAAKNGLFMAWMLIPAILLVLSFVAMYFFPLHGKKWNDEKAELAKKHTEKEAAYEQEVLKKQAEQETSAA